MAQSGSRTPIRRWGLVVTIGVSYWVGHSRFGVRLNAIREDEVAAEAMGINTTFYKLAAFSLSAVFPGRLSATLST